MNPRPPALLARLGPFLGLVLVPALIQLSEPTDPYLNSFAGFCL